MERQMRQTYGIKNPRLKIECSQTSLWISFIVYVNDIPNDIVYVNDIPNDIPNFISKSSVYLFVDDTKIRKLYTT